MKKNDEGGWKEVVFILFFWLPTVPFQPHPTHTHTHIRGRHSLDEKNTKTPPWPVTWHQLPANQQPTGLSWQPIKDPHSHAEQRPITMATLTHTLSHTHTHKSSLLSFTISSPGPLPFCRRSSDAVQRLFVFPVQMTVNVFSVPLCHAAKNLLRSAQWATHQLR